ncbi:salicylate carboxymethyltransferase [Senna tora]|uniref:Salicylate carboxymethyltransferase n=1 Tax=Senna tora TaxID=362788 RepID=A0A834W539_9FABA|nr:salicylate carboxymethyltransferase [Senna tora]
MDIEKVFHMTGGIGNTSYAKNSSLQKEASDKVKHIIIETVQKLFVETTPKSIGIADLGCSSGPNTLSIIKDIFEAIQGIPNSPSPNNDNNNNNNISSSEFRVYLNDLPTNDFNSIFKNLPEFHSLLRQQGNNNVPRAVYDEEGRSLNKGSIYISESSPEVVVEAYFKQFQEDFSLFLRSRSEEVVLGGRMVLIFLGREGPSHVDRGNSFFWKILYRSFATLVSKGEVEEEKVDSYDVHFYAASREEIEDEVRKEGSFELERMEMSEIRERNYEESSGKESYGMVVAKTV